MENFIQVRIDDYVDCKRCEKLCKSRSQIVWGYGVMRPIVMFVGEAPGAIEDEQGKPFVGPAGETHHAFLEDAGIPDKLIYTTNAVLCRPVTGDMPKIAENRTPSLDEVKNCRDRLVQEILIVDPLVIVALGKIGFYALTGKNTPIKSDFGNIIDTNIGGVRFPVMYVFHPSYLRTKGTDEEIGLQKKAYDFLKKVIDYWTSLD
uniref:Uracil-DNA glycosylase n=1 Tax=Dictyoglomus turgidum TaxID=513050 RepID=A0A7C3SQS2_9BACT